jgi:UDP-N-acetylmuramate dehydrogenase
VWEIEKTAPAEVKALIDQTLARRKDSQPVEFPSCGSVFKNPKASDLSAWQVIDQLGLRGHRVGDAQFSEKHSNFIINLGRATALDVRTLIELAKKRAMEEMGIPLEEEVIYVGSFAGF